MIPKIIHGLTLIVGALFVVMCVYVVSARIGVPFELEWMEGGMVDHVARVLDGKALYGKPEPEFIAFIYAPFYYYVSALLATITGNGYLPLRLVACLGALGSAVLIFLFVHRETASRQFAFLALSMFAASYAAVGTWFDIARPDTLSLMLLLAGAYLLRWRDGLAGQFAAGVLLGLAVYAKQPNLLVALALCLLSLIQLRSSPRFGALLGLAGVLVPTTLAQQWLSHGWYWFYVVELPGQHKLLPVMAGWFWWHDIGATAGPAFALMCFALWAMRRSGDAGGFRFYATLFAALIVDSCLSRVNIGAFVNVLLPAMAALAMGLGLAGHYLARSDGRGSLKLGLFALLVLGQFALLRYDPSAYLPTTTDRRIGQTLLAVARQADGPVLVLSHGDVASRAGKQASVHGMALNDIYRGGDEAEIRRLEDDMRTLIGGRHYRLIVVDQEFRGFYAPAIVDAIEAHYRREEFPYLGDGARWPKIGLDIHPVAMYRPK